MEDILKIDDYYKLWLLLTQTKSAIFKAREIRTKNQLPPTQAAALIIVWNSHGEATPTIISRYLSLERHSVSELITRMELTGLVTKNRDPKSKKILRIAITQKGKEDCYKAMDVDFIRKIISSLSENQRKQLELLLQILLKATSDGSEIINF